MSKFRIDSKDLGDLINSLINPDIIYRAIVISMESNKMIIVRTSIELIIEYDSNNSGVKYRNSNYSYFSYVIIFLFFICFNLNYIYTPRSRI